MIGVQKEIELLMRSSDCLGVSPEPGPLNSPSLSSFFDFWIGTSWIGPRCWYQCINVQEDQQGFLSLEVFWILLLFYTHFLRIRGDHATEGWLSRSKGEWALAFTTVEFWMSREYCPIELEKRARTSLVVQWLRICLPMQGTWVVSLLQEDPTRCRACKTMCLNSWDRTSQSLYSATRQASAMRSLCPATRE